MTDKDEEQLTYEQALGKLDERLVALENGQLTLEQAIAAVESGRRYLAICQQKLDQARQKIESMPVAEEGMDLPAPSPQEPLREGPARKDRSGEVREVPF
jgi:exodeoxyribonuclease VII small subunit